ncbi:uncharacterized protein MONBRDRAFT_20699 [Monosiga brevicollis MX1]|uniref:Translin n=1 Tax=Monosiga brevicollis TaxID=81824 RepID=A9UX38_MONBE|nr:uncharacterized protein MONBRDRAFT_20699 [Monosiga brevicollis MX1]EDQ90324.1 predicted protein [Monosiga brevicollis MX1]|eukprot:XP_001745091.1 hypothetical protein [Monosiga brevicollis MX1]
MDQRKRQNGRGGGQGPKRSKADEPVLRDDASEVERQFFGYAKRLTDKHDRYERLVKLSRDVTIHSKRAIFILHRITAENKDTTLQEAREKLVEIRENLRAIARELQGHDPFLYARAFSPGLQEYIEAATFLAFNEDGRLATLAELEEAIAQPEKPSEPVEGDAGAEAPVALAIPPLDYILGIADLTGELMRMCINNLGDEALTSSIMTFVRQCFDAFRHLPHRMHDKDLRFKIDVLESSLKKIENACYTLTVRGTEIPKDQLLDSLRHQGSGADDN